MENFIHYNIELLRHAITDAKNGFAQDGAAITRAAIFSLASAVTVYVLRFQGSVSIVDSLANTVIGFAIGVVVWFLVLVIKNFIGAPSKLHQKLSNEIVVRDATISEMRSKWEVSPIKANLDIDVFSPYHAKKVGILIHNTLSQKLTHLRIELADVIWIDKSERRSLKVDDSPYHCFTDIESRELEAILGGETIRVNIAEAHPARGLVMLPYRDYDGYNLAHMAYLWSTGNLESDMEIRLEITGYISDKPIALEVFEALIHFQAHKSVLIPQAGRPPEIIDSDAFLTIRKGKWD